MILRWIKQKKEACPHIKGELKLDLLEYVFNENLSCEMIKCCKRGPQHYICALVHYQT